MLKLTVKLFMNKYIKNNSNIRCDVYTEIPTTMI